MTTDSLAAQAYAEYLVRSRSIRHVDHGHAVVTYVLDERTPAASPIAGRALHDAILRVRDFLHTDDMTIVIDVQLPIMPHFVTATFETLVGYGAGFVVLHKGQCSLDRENSLPVQLREALAGAGSKRQIWHPVLEQPARMLNVR